MEGKAIYWMDPLFKVVDQTPPSIPLIAKLISWLKLTHQQLLSCLSAGFSRFLLQRDSKHDLNMSLGSKPAVQEIVEMYKKPVKVIIKSLFPYFFPQKTGVQ